MSPRKADANVKLVPAADGKYYCPECKVGPYNTAKGLSTHRRVVHNIAGTAKSTLAARANKKAQSAGADKERTPLSSEDLRREERDYKREYRLRKKRESLSTEPASIPAEHKPQPTTPSAKENKKNASNQHGKKRGPYKPRTTARTTPSREIIPTFREPVDSEVQATEPRFYDHQNPPRIPDSTLAVAYGRLLEFSAGLAREYDLPQRQFTAELFTLVRRST